MFDVREPGHGRTLRDVRRVEIARRTAPRGLSRRANVAALVSAG